MAEHRLYPRSLVAPFTRSASKQKAVSPEAEDDLALKDMEVHLSAVFAGQVSNLCGGPCSHFHSLLQQIADEYDRVVEDLSGRASANDSVRARRAASKVTRENFIAPKHKTQIPEVLVDPVQPSEPASSRAPSVIALVEGELLGLMEEEGLPKPPKPVTNLSSLTKPGISMGNFVKQISEPLSGLSDPKSLVSSCSTPRWEPDSPRSCGDGSQTSMDFFQPEEKLLELDPRWDKGQGFLRKFKSRQDLVQEQADVVPEGDPDAADLTTNYKGMLRCCVGLPSTPKRVAWDIMGMVTIMYELFLTPLRVFDPPENTFTDIMDWFALVFWCTDMLVRLTTAYQHNGVYETNPVKIAKNYLKFWFWIDFVVVIPDLAFTIAKHTQATDSNAGSSVKLIRILRLMRVIRLVRLAKLRWIIANLKDHIDSEHIDISFNVLKLLLALAVLSHFIGCAWFSLTLLDDAGPTWITKYHLEAHKVGWLFQYTTAFRWAIAQFSPSSIPITAQNNAEQLFSIFVVFFGLVGFSYLVGSITGSLAELTRMSQEGTQQFWKVRRFLKRSNVPLQLRIKIEKYLEHAWHVQKNSIGIGNTPILKLLTEQLMNELNLSMSMPHLEVHPLLAFLSSQCPYAMQRISTKALKRQLFARKECVFYAREIAQHMSFVVAGRLKYIKKTPAGKPDHTEWVDKCEDWVTEPALWTSEWTTLGKLMAVSVSELLVVSSADFADAIIRTPQVFDRVSTYAANFMRWINSHLSTDLSDVMQGEEHSEQITKMLWDDDCRSHEAQDCGVSQAQSTEHIQNDDPFSLGVVPAPK